MPYITIGFSENDKPENCTLTDEEFEVWLENNGGALRDSLIAHGNDWIETHLEIDGHLPEEAYIDVSSEGTAELVHPDGRREPAPEGWEYLRHIKATRIDQ